MFFLVRSAEIPNYGAALIFELHSSLGVDDTMWAVSLQQQDGSAAEYVTVELPCASPTALQIVGSHSACMLKDFQELVAPEQFKWQVCGRLSASSCFIATSRAVRNAEFLMSSQCTYAVTATQTLTNKLKAEHCTAQHCISRRGFSIHYGSCCTAWLSWELCAE